MMVLLSIDTVASASTNKREISPQNKRLADIREGVALLGNAANGSRVGMIALIAVKDAIIVLVGKLYVIKTKRWLTRCEHFQLVNQSLLVNQFYVTIYQTIAMQRK